MGNLMTFTNQNIGNNSLAKFWLLASAFMLWACSSDDKSESIEQEKQLVFEILQIQSPNSIVVWMNSDMDQATFEAIELPDGWIKNQVRAIEPDNSRFLRSPSNRRLPRVSSNCFSIMETADGVRPSASAASERLPWVATIIKHLSISILIAT